MSVHVPFFCQDLPYMRLYQVQPMKIRRRRANEANSGNDTMMFAGVTLARKHLVTLNDTTESTVFAHEERPTNHCCRDGG